jgi:hypothetical protein
MSTDGKSSYHVKEKNLLEMSSLGLTSEDQKVVEDIVKMRPYSVDLELIAPSGTEMRQVAIAVASVVERFGKLIGKQAAISFKAIAEGYREDQAGKKDGYSKAESALDKLNKYVENVMEEFRTELRETAAKNTGKKAKQFMTVGRVQVKKFTFVLGAFQGETAVDKKETPDSDELGAALKYKKWQHVGLASTRELAKIVVNRKKELKKNELREMSNLFPSEARNGLVFSRGMILAESETNLTFEFLKKTRVGKDPKTYTLRLKAGLREQLNKNVHLDVEPVASYTADGPSPKTKTSTTTSTGTQGTKAKSPPPKTGTTTTATTT